MEKIIKVSGIDVPFKSSGALPRFYRVLMNRDLFKDMDALKDINPEKPFENDIMTVVENIAYAMARHADPNEKRDIDEWLEQFSMFGVAEAMNDIVNLWNAEVKTDSNAKKNSEQ